MSIDNANDLDEFCDLLVAACDAFHKKWNDFQQAADNLDKETRDKWHETLVKMKTHLKNKTLKYAYARWREAEKTYKQSEDHYLACLEQSES